MSHLCFSMGPKVIVVLAERLKFVASGNAQDVAVNLTVFSGKTFAELAYLKLN